MLRTLRPVDWRTVAFIRVGFFKDFKSADTLMIDIDHEGLHTLIAWLRMDMPSGLMTPISNCPASVIQSGLQVKLLRVVEDVGIVRTAAMEAGACHQYLDGPRDDLQIMASIGEYGDAWWQRHES
jgi:hypothetical protein